MCNGFGGHDVIVVQIVNGKEEKLFAICGNIPLL
jgi:hypothetical protein